MARLSILSRIQRQMLVCVRAVCFPAEAGACRSDFGICTAVRLMTGPLAGSQLSIWRPGAMFLSRDEILLLTSLAAMQRQHCHIVPSALGPDLIEALQRCAAALAEAGVRLPLKVIVSFNKIGQPALPVVGPEGFNAAQRTAVRGVRNRSVAAVALGMVRERGLVSTREFEAAGVSRQYLSMLCNKGYLRRLRHGWYGPCLDPGL